MNDDLEEMRRQLLAMLRPQRLLELDCGDGGTALRTALEFAASLTALDRSPWMVEQARAKGVLAGIGDGTALPFADATFDCVLATCLSAERGTIDDTVSEIGRVLESNGTLLARAQPPESRPLGSGNGHRGLNEEQQESLLREHFADVSRHRINPGKSAAAATVFVARR
jgi:ubiquinone/menaquinone biosynthesis C-methylase UbiE